MIIIAANMRSRLGIYLTCNLITFFLFSADSKPAMAYCIIHRTDDGSLSMRHKPPWNFDLIASGSKMRTVREFRQTLLLGTA